MSSSNIYVLENIFRAKLIDALNKDIKTSIHSGENNHQVLDAALSLLEMEGDLGFSLDQIMIGVMNMAIGLQISKYRNISAASVGDEAYKMYINELNYWFAGYNKELKSRGSLSTRDAMEIAIPVINRAARSRLYITPCVPHTLNLYFEYLQRLDSTFIPPQIPTGDTFASWEKDQFVCFNTAYSSSLLSLSLFAVKKHKLPTDELPADLNEKLDSLDVDVSEKGNEDARELDTSSSCCVII